MYVVNWRKSIGHDIPVITTEWGCWLFQKRNESPDLPAWLDFTLNLFHANNIGNMWYVAIQNNQRAFSIFDSETGWNQHVLDKLTGARPTKWPSINQIIDGEFHPNDQAWQLTTDQITKEIVTSGAYSGNSMLKLTVPDLKGAGGQIYQQTTAKPPGPAGRTLLHLVQGTAYKISFMAGTEAGQQGRIQVRLKDASDGTLIQEFKAIDVSPGPSTYEVKMEFDGGLRSANAMDVRLEFDVGFMKQVLYLDKVKFMRDTQALEYV